MIGSGLILLAVFLVARVAVKSRSLPVGILAASMGVFYAVRAVGVGLGLDDPYPDFLFQGTELNGPLIRLGLLLLVFVLSFLVTYRKSGPIARPLAWALPLPPRRILLGPLLIATVFFSGLATLIALNQIVRYGGSSQAIYAAKAGRTSGEGILRIPATLALVLSCSTLYAAGRLAGGKLAAGTIRLIAGASAIVAALAASVWGSRQFTVLAAGYLLGSRAITAFRQGKRGWLVGSTILFSAVIGFGFWLRLYRDDVLGGRTAISEAQGQQFRRVTLSMNGSTLDSSLLAVRDWPSRNGWLGSDLFTNGLWGAVPAQLRPEGLLVDSAGAQFHRFYEPLAKSGWPIGAPVEWFISFGWAGVIIGGLLSGLIYRSMTLALRRSPSPELATVSALILTIVVFPLGVSASSANRFVIHALPLFLLLLPLQALSRSLEEARASAIKRTPRSLRGHRGSLPTGRPAPAGRRRGIAEVRRVAQPVDRSGSARRMGGARRSAREVTAAVVSSPPPSSTIDHKAAAAAAGSGIRPRGNRSRRRELLRASQRSQPLRSRRQQSWESR
ncbi:MAG: oligosaccharide repeat unit polymerase [Tetrasphaera sp.]|nr:oligosaccharide repeat unit polymerase [Tetrasphaera sp.]